MTIFQTLILSLVEGITEFLPISSTAHLILTSHILGISPNDFLSTFEVAIQIGAIAAVAFWYLGKIKSNFSILIKACIGFIPTGLIGFLLYDRIKLLFNNPFVPVATLFIGGIAIILLELLVFKKERNNSTNLQNLSYKSALLIGLFQSISMIPGVSRAAASIFGGQVLKLTRKDAVEFSFLIAIPTMTAATGFDLLEQARSFNSEEILILIIGIAGSFISALIVIKWLLKYIQNNSFVVFGIYRIIVSILYYIIFLR